MLNTMPNTLDLIGLDNDAYIAKRLYDKNNILSIIQILDILGRICRCLFYEDGKRLSNMSIYNPSSGKEVKNITYRADGKTISSVREYNKETEKLMSVTFFKEDGVSVSSIIKYDESGSEVSFTLYCDDGEVVTQSL